MYAQVRGRRIKSREYRRFEALVIDTAIKYRLGTEKLPEGPIACYVEFYGSWYTKLGKIRKKDVDSGIKALIDCVFRAIGEDDSKIFRLHVQKVKADFNRSTLSLRPL